MSKFEGVVSTKVFHPTLNRLVTEEEFKAFLQASDAQTSKEIDEIFETVLPEVIKARQEGRKPNLSRTIEGEVTVSEPKPKAGGQFIHPLVKENPHKAGTQSFETFKAFLKEYETNKQITLLRCKEMNLRMNTIFGDIRNKFLEAK